MSKIDFRGRYGSAGSKEVYFARIKKGLSVDALKKQSLIDLIKASFGGDRSAAGKYAAEQRWKGHVKNATKPAVRERRIAEKFQEGPILKNGYDNFGFPKLLTPDEAKKRFGDTVLKQMAYFQGRGLELYVSDKASDGSPKFDTESPAYFAVLQALDDVMDQVDATKLNADPKHGLFPNVRIDDYFSNSGDTTGGYFESTSNKVALFMNTAQLIEKGYTDGRPFQISTVPQLAADAIQGLHGGDSISARIAYGFTVHEMGHWVDDALGNQWDGPPKGFWSDTLIDRVRKDPAKASDDERSFSLGYYDFFGPGDKGSQYSNTAPVERFAENFTAWFTLTKVNAGPTNELKRSLAAQGGFLAVGAALEVLKQDRIVDNVLNWRPDHPVFLFAFRGKPFDVDAFRQQLLVGMIKASFAGDRSAAGRYAANMRWKGHKKEVTAPKQARDLTEELKTYFGTNTEEYKKSQGYKDLRQKLIDKQSKGTGIGDLQLEIIADKQGFSGLPRVVSSAEMDQLEKDGWTIAYRGIADSYFDDMIEFRAERLAEQFRTGEYFAGVGTSGNGIYFAKDRMTAESYAGNVEVNVLGGIAYRSTRKVPQGVVIKVAIPPGALMTEVQFRQELSKQKDLYTGSGFNGEWHGESDVGRKLAAKGTKGVELKLSFGLGADRESAFLVWDRSMLAVEESTQTK